MEIKEIDNQLKNSSIWEKKANHPLQSWSFGEARRELGIEVLRLGEFKKDALINIFQISLHPLIGDYKIGYLPRSLFPSSKMLNYLYQWGKKNKIVFIKIEPYEEQNRNLFFQISRDNNFILLKSPHPLFPEWTQMIDLQKSEDELFKNLHYKTRYNIRLAQKKNVVIKQMDNEQGFEIFIKLYFETCQRQKYHGHNYRYHSTIWKKFQKKIAHILIAFYKNFPLASYQVWLYKNRLYYVYGGSSNQYRNLMASNLLMWETIRFGKFNKAKIFDLWGSLPPNYSLNHPWAGFTRFKQGYGGRFVQLIGSYDLIINPFLYNLYSFVYPFRKFFLKFLILFLI